VALKQYAKETRDKGYIVKDTGFWVDVEHSWMGGSPDGMVSTPDDGDGTLEIKCPYSCKEMGREEMLAKKGFYL